MGHKKNSEKCSEQIKAVIDPESIGNLQVLGYNVQRQLEEHPRNTGHIESRKTMTNICYF